MHKNILKKKKKLVAAGTRPRWRGGRLLYGPNLEICASSQCKKKRKEKFRNNFVEETAQFFSNTESFYTTNCNNNLLYIKKNKNINVHGFGISNEFLMH